VSSFSRVLRVPPGLYTALVHLTFRAHVSNYSPPIRDTFRDTVRSVAASVVEARDAYWMTRDGS